MEDISNSQPPKGIRYEVQSYGFPHPPGRFSPLLPLKIFL